MNNDILTVSLGSLMNRKRQKNFKGSNIDTVYSVTKEKGIIKSDDLHDFNVYSNDLSNYLILNFNEYAYNPARLNIGSIARLKKNKPGLVSPMYVIFELDNTKILNKYYEYLLFSSSVFNDMCSFVEQGARFRFDYKNWDKIVVSIPTLDKQKQIVEKLDAFKNLEKELEKELNIRKKQFEYYKTKMFQNAISQHFKLDEVVLFSNGKAHEKIVADDGEYILVTSKAISTNMEDVRLVSEQLSPLYKNDITLVMSDLPNGKTLAKCFIVDQDHKYSLNQRVCQLTVKEEFVLPKYLYYFLNRNKQLLKYDNGVDQTNLKKSDILEIIINIPTLDKQKEIVEKLDAFKKLEEELEKELNIRRKQFEYYRNKLLSFEEVRNG